MKIITRNIYPPIPTRQCDWCAFYEGEEELGHYGYGATEQEAIDDLIGHVQPPGGSLKRTAAIPQARLVHAKP